MILEEVIFLGIYYH